MATVIVAFDLDGTLADCRHRLHFIAGNAKDWKSFFEACSGDTPIKEIIAVATALYNRGYTIEIWSGRSDLVRRETTSCLFKHHVPHNVLRMRENGDHRDDVVVKEEWLMAIPEYARPVLAFDDRQRIVDMWRRHGIRCCQVAPGDF